MFCKHLRKRSYKKEIYFYCIKKHEKVSKIDCSTCNEKEYKTIKKMKNRTSKRAKACDISPSVKKIVFERDKGFCVVCGKAGVPNSHYIRRGQGGLGIPENVVTMCIECHNAYDNGHDEKMVKEIQAKVKKYLKRQYKENWNEEDLYYKKGN